MARSSRSTTGSSGDASPAPALDASPVTEDEASDFLAPLAIYPHVALAVSGGSDSTALLWLVARWRKSRPEAPRATVLSVDHGLRPDSADEARKVLALADTLSLPAVALAWKGRKPATGIQQAAREARYALMTDWCRGNAVPALVTAHTLDDQAETFLMRLARGSGLDGLAGIGDSRRSGTDILRPLLGISRARLRSTLKEAGVAWIEDPSNSDDRFERVRWRRALERLRPEGIEASDIALSAHRLARARKALDAALEQLEAAAVVSGARTQAEIDAGPYDTAPEELRIRLLKGLIERIGGGAVELQALERMESALRAEGTVRTLGGCRLERRRGRLRIGRELPRGRPKSATESPG